MREVPLNGEQAYLDGFNLEDNPFVGEDDELTEMWDDEYREASDIDSFFAFMMF